MELGLGIDCLSYLGVQIMYLALQNNDSNGNNKRYFETGQLEINEKIMSRYLDRIIVNHQKDRAFWKNRQGKEAMDEILWLWVGDKRLSMFSLAIKEYLSAGHGGICL